MNTIAMIMVLVFGIYVFRNDGWRIIQAKRYGIETDAADYYRRFFYVTLRTTDGLQNEARLINPKGGLVTGSTIKVKYLPEKNDYAVMTKV